MEEKWILQVYGVRGSAPAAEKEFLTYGGNTSCISLDYGRGVLVFDAGTGLSGLGRRMCDKNIKRVDILLSHLHMDHLSGLFGFLPFYDPEAEIHIYGQASIGFPEYLHLLVGRPFWPVGLKEVPARIRFHEIEPGQSFAFAEKDPARKNPAEKNLAGKNHAGEKEPEKGIQIDTLQGNHPGGSLLYRVRTAEKSVVYALDCEMSEEMSDALADFSKGSDLLIWDAAFTPRDLEKHKGWGHSTWEQGIALRRRAGAKAALMTHFSQGYTDGFLQQQEQLAREADSAACFAREGMVIRI